MLRSANDARIERVMIRIIATVVLCLFSTFPAWAQADSTAADTLGQTVYEEAAADTALAARLRAVYGSIEAFQDVQVHLQSNVVHLTGTVDQPEDRERAEDLAARFPDVLYVINDLETNIEVEARVSPAIERIESYITDAIAYLPIVGIALVVLLLFWLLAALVGRFEGSRVRLGLSPMVQNLVGRLLRLVVFVIGLVLALDILGITALVGTILGAAGLAGIAIGFAFQDIIENYLAGLLMSIRHPFSLSDHVKIGDVEGKVLRLTSRELVLMTLDGNHVRLPNATVFKGTIYNYTRNPRRRFDFEVGVGTEEDLVRVREIGLETLNAMQGVMDDPAPFMRIKALGDFNVLVTFFGWVDQTAADFGKVHSEAIRLVKAALDEAGVSMPEPIYIVRMQAVPEAAPETPDGEETSEPSATAQARQADVEVDTTLDEQIREDHVKTDEPNLLAP